MVHKIPKVTAIAPRSKFTGLKFHAHAHLLVPHVWYLVFCLRYFALLCTEAIWLTCLLYKIQNGTLRTFNTETSLFGPGKHTSFKYYLPILQRTYNTENSLFGPGKHTSFKYYLPILLIIFTIHFPWHYLILRSNISDNSWNRCLANWKYPAYTLGYFRISRNLRIINIALLYQYHYYLSTIYQFHIWHWSKSLYSRILWKRYCYTGIS